MSETGTPRHGDLGRSCSKRTDKAQTIPNAQNYLKVFYVNARSIRNKFSDLEEIALTNNYDIIAITESWLNTDDRDFLAEYRLPNYVMFEKS